MLPIGSKVCFFYYFMYFKVPRFFLYESGHCTFPFVNRGQNRIPYSHDKDKIGNYILAPIFYEVGIKMLNYIYIQL